MIRFRLPIFAILSLISLLLCAAIITLWIRSYFGSDYISRSTLIDSQPHMVVHHSYTIILTRGSIRLASEDSTYYSHRATMPIHPLARPANWTYGRLGVGHIHWEELPVRTFWNRLGFHTFNSGLETSFSSSREEGIAVPTWLPTALFAIPPLLWARPLLKSRRRHRAGLCPHCGYDIRATPQRCPECGRVTLANH